MINLNNKEPYVAFVEISAGSDYFLFDSFTVNQILKDVDVFVSIPKMKEHYEAGVTAALKNQVGMVPKQLYVIPTDQGRRARLHSADGGSSAWHLPRAICDLARARPVHLTVIDGIKNARGGEGVWNPTFRLAEDHVLIAGKEPVAADSIAAYLMGHDPEAARILLPTGMECDNYLDLLHQKGVGTNQLSEIEPVGDGAGLVTSVAGDPGAALPAGYGLLGNYPNPFNPSTEIRFGVPIRSEVTLAVYDELGRHVRTLLEEVVGAGYHEVRFDGRGLSSGVYYCRLLTRGAVQTRRLLLVR
jgi:hypothetical protein